MQAFFKLIRKRKLTIRFIFSCLYVKDILENFLKKKSY